MRVIKMFKQVWRREPEEPTIGAAERKYADVPSILRVVDRAAKRTA